MAVITEKELQDIWKLSDGGEYSAIRDALVSKGLALKTGGKFFNFSYKFQVKTKKLDDLRRIAYLLYENNFFEMKVIGNFGRTDTMKMVEIRFQHLNTLSELRLYCAYLDINDNAGETIKRLNSYPQEILDRIQL